MKTVNITLLGFVSIKIGQGRVLKTKCWEVNCNTILHNLKIAIVIEWSIHIIYISISNY